ncbi:ABC transporter permease [Microbacterium pullorum]|uniref:ABC transporter permease n=1 Tax=Microbacterium pullorum TaxID=2762236 RepID=UPI001CD8FCE5
MSVLALGAHRAAYEVRGYFRAGDTLFFTFLFPVFMLALFSTIFQEEGGIAGGPGVPELSAAELYLPAMLAAGLLLSGFQNLAVDIAMERSDGTLKRLGGTPLSPVSYFTGKIAQVLTTGILQAFILIVVAAVVFDVSLPTDADSWITFTWVFFLGLIASALLGIAVSALPRSGRSATAVVVPIALVLQFVSGVYIFFWQLPDWLQYVASAFPLVWMARGMRAAFLPAEYATLEPGDGWELGWVALALGIWLLVGLILSRATFRWIRRDA